MPHRRERLFLPFQEIGGSSDCHSCWPSNSEGCPIPRTASELAKMVFVCFFADRARRMRGKGPFASHPGPQLRRPGAPHLTGSVCVLIFCYRENKKKILRVPRGQHLRRPVVISGAVVEVQTSPADHHATSAGSGATGGEDLHRQVRQKVQVTFLHCAAV